MGVDGLPLEWEELSEESRESLKKTFGPENMNPNVTDMIRYPAVQVAVPRSYLKLADDLYRFPTRDDDVWVVTFPKCGTTWMQETLSMVVSNVDKEYCKIPQFLRSPFLEFDMILDGLPPKTLAFPDNPVIQKRAEAMKEAKGIIPYARNMTDSPRVLKSHMPFAFLPPNLHEKCKVVYVARSPKDVIVSYYYHNVNIPIHGYKGSLSEFAEQVMKDDVLYGSFWSHLESGWKLREHPNVKFVWYEEMKKDSRKVITELSEFLGYPLTEAKKDELVEHISFKVMKENPAANPGKAMQLPPERDFMRKGEVGDWKQHFSGAELEKIDAWVAENLERTGIVLP